MKIYRPIIEDDIEFCNADGEVTEKVHFAIDVNKSYKEIVAAYASLKAQTTISRENPDNEEAAQRALDLFWQLCVAVFGDTLTGKLRDWYPDEGFLTSLLVPILFEKIYPQLMKLRGQTFDAKKAVSKYAEQETADDV